MSLVINSNMTASRSALNLSRSNDLLRKSMLRLSSGKRIVNPADDAGGLAVGLKLQSALRRTAATKQNIQNGVSYLQMQDGALKVVGNVIDRMAELRSYSNDVTKNEQDRQNYNYEFKELQEQLVELRRSKFNGVSLFSTTETDPGLIRIITTEDGLTGKVDLNRNGLFENLKSKYGADGELNSGSHGSYRQLVGDFSRDGGRHDPMLGKTSRDYKNGAVVYVDGPTDASQGYFMALKDVRAGSFIEDTAGAGSNWIRLADGSGQGFAEAFPESPVYNPFSNKKSAAGADMSYLKGDVVQVPAHWAGGSFYMKAQQDVPYGMTLAELFDGGHVGTGKYFDYVGQERSGGATTGGKATTDHVRANANLPEPELYDPTTRSSLINLMENHSSENFTPEYVKVMKSGAPAPSPLPVLGSFQQDKLENIWGSYQPKVIQLDGLNGSPTDAYEFTFTDKDGKEFQASVQWAGPQGNSFPSRSGGVIPNMNPGIAGSNHNDSTPTADAIAAAINASAANHLVSAKVIRKQTVEDEMSDKQIYNDPGNATTDSLGNTIAPIYGDLDDIGAPDAVSVLITGKPGAGDFIYKGQAHDNSNTGTANLGTNASIQNYLADKYEVGIKGHYTGVDGITQIEVNKTISAKYDYSFADGSAGTTADALAFEINNDEDLKKVVVAEAKYKSGTSGDKELFITAKEHGQYKKVWNAVEKKWEDAKDGAGNKIPQLVTTLTDPRTNDDHNDVTGGAISSPGKPLLEDWGIERKRHDTGALAPPYGPDGVLTYPATGNDDAPTDPPYNTHAASFIKNTEFVEKFVTPDPDAPTAPYDVYVPSHNWGVEKWKTDYPFKAGALVLDATGEKVHRLSDQVKGAWLGDKAEAGDFVLHNGIWYQAPAKIEGDDAKVNPGTTGSLWSALADPLDSTLTFGFSEDKTTDFEDLSSDSKYWNKTHFGHLVSPTPDGNGTIESNYTRGDNIHYKGKHYVYVSNLPSNDPSYLSPLGDGYTEIDELIRSGAVREAGLYVDTKGGGGSADLPTSVYYRPNQELEHIDRLPDSGLARANSIARRTNAMTPPGDDIFNSADDMYHGGLDAGSDGIYGTADDFYASTTNQAVAKSGFHVDGDADNNMDLLDAKHDLSDFSVADFVDYIQSLANFRAINGGTMSRLSYSTQMLEENQINLESAVSRIMDADMALEASKLARQNVLVQTGATMLAQANQLSNVVLSLLQ